MPGLRQRLRKDDEERGDSPFNPLPYFDPLVRSVVYRQRTRQAALLVTSAPNTSLTVMA